MVCIALDIGTSYASVGVWKNDAALVVANDQGNLSTPSYIAFTETEILVGEAAKVHASLNAINTIYDFKLLLGHKYSDAIVQELILDWPFHVVAGKDDEPLVEVQYKGETKQYSAEELTSILILKMVEFAQAALGIENKDFVNSKGVVKAAKSDNDTLTDAVIAVAAFFDSKQREAIKRAVEMAGLTPVCLLTDAVAACMAHDMDVAGSVGSRQVLVYNIGGGGVDATLVNVINGVFSVLGSYKMMNSGGGGILDRILVRHFAQEFKKQSGTDLIALRKTSDKNHKCRHALEALRSACELVKHTLSSQESATLECDSLYQGEDFFSSLTRAKFEMLCSSTWRQWVEPVVTNVLKVANKDKSWITEVIVTGGSAKINKLQKQLLNYLHTDGIRIHIGGSSEEMIIRGATIQAHVIDNSKEDIEFDKTKGKLIVKSSGADAIVKIDRPATSLHLGVEGSRGEFITILPKDTMVPTPVSAIDAVTNTTTTAQRYLHTFQLAPKQAKVSINVYEGLRAKVADCTLLACLCIEVKHVHVNASLSISMSTSEDGITSLCAWQWKDDERQPIGTIHRLEIPAKSKAKSIADVEKCIADSNKQANIDSDAAFLNKLQVEQEAVVEEIATVPAVSVQDVEVDVEELDDLD